MSEDLWTLVRIASWMVSVVCWSIILADTRVGAWIVDNPVSRRYILPIWERTREVVRWAGRKVTRRTNGE